MKLLLQIISVLICLSATAQKLYHLPNNISASDYLPNTIILKVKSDYRNVCAIDKINHSTFNTLASSIGANHLSKKFPLDRAPEKTHNQSGQRYADLSLIYELKYSSNTDIEKAISKLLVSGILEYAEPHFIPKLAYNPNDPLANSTNQYHLQTIQAFAGWDIDKGDSSIVIGITDTGTDPTHNDLFTNIKRNYNDPIDGIDNDTDGFIDNYMGWDVGVNDNDATWQANAHGVHVSGLSSASADNAIGGSGTGFNCKFMPVKISDGGGNLIAAYEGIKYAADHGCHIINCSWGGGGASQYGQDIVTYASINKNCLVVAAAGNNNSDMDFFPAAYNYALAIGNTTSTDAKQSSSNFGYFVDVCAPGDNVNSTWPGNFYITSSGTSMSSPVVSGAAGIVKHHFPSYNGLQVAERLKITCDDIYAQNPSFLNKLGNGRINLFRALNDPSSPSVVFTDKNISDHNDEAFIIGDTLFIKGIFINYLDPTTALTVSITSLSGYATVIDNTTSLGVINTMGVTNNNNDAFQFKLTGAIPINQSIDFEVLLQDGSYQAKQFFSVFVNVDYLNITVNDVYTTATSKGKIGYNKDAQGQGLGFKYKGTDLLYEAGLMIGVDSVNRVSDCVRGANTSVSDIDFMTINRIAKQIPAVTSDFDTHNKMNDNSAFNPIFIDIDQNTYAWSSAPNNQFVIWEYNIKNTHASDTLKNMYVGIFADWDIDGATYAQNRSGYDAGTKMGYSFYTATNGKYAGIKLLTNTAAPNFYAVDHVSGGNGGIDFANGVDTFDKYKTLSTSRLVAGTNGTGNDVINVMSSGPFTLNPNETVKVAFALLGGDSLANLITGAQQAQIKYDETTLVKENIINNDISIYPNPTKNSITISQADKIFTSFEIYDLTGKIISGNKIQNNLQKVDLSNYAEGMYVVKLIGKEKVEFKKIVVAE